MTDTEQRNAATKFYNDWRGIGDEKSDCQRFWIDFFTNVLGVENVLQKIQFEKRVVVDGQTKYIDVYIPETRVLIEQKSIDKDLDKKMPQSDGSMRTPFEQGRGYAQWMIPNETPLWIVACNFKSFEIHDMNKPNEPAVIILLEEVRNKLPLFDFMFQKEVKELSHEMEISVKAGEIVGILYNKLIAQYKEPNEHSYKSLNALCVRLVFCLYAEDAGIFGSHIMFHDYLKDIPVNDFRKALIELFRILDTKKTGTNGGMHYTSIENIHKVIDPLFMDELKEEFHKIKKIAVERTRKAKLNAFQKKIAELKFLDMNLRYLIQPSCTENQKEDRNKDFRHSQVYGCLYSI